MDAIGALITAISIAIAIGAYVLIRGAADAFRYRAVDLSKLREEELIRLIASGKLTIRYKKEDEDEKPKRHGYFEIGDDGELIEVFEDEG